MGVEIKKSRLESPPAPFQKLTPGSPQSSSSAVPLPSDDAEINASSSDNDTDDESPLQILNSDGICMKCK